MPETDIVIAHYGTGDLTAFCLACLESIRRWTRNYRLIFVDNASPEFDQVLPELERHDHILIRNTQNEGFIKASNAGLAISKAPRVVLMNNDTLAVDGWADQLHEAFAIAGVGLAGPLTDTPDSWQGAWRKTGNHIHVLAPNRMLAFFCVMLDRAVLDRVGLLDESYGVGFGDDDDYCRRAEWAGFKLALCQSLTIPHRHRSTFKTLYGPEQIGRMQQRALRKFRRERISRRDSC